LVITGFRDFLTGRPSATLAIVLNDSIILNLSHKIWPIQETPLRHRFAIGKTMFNLRPIRHTHDKKIHLSVPSNLKHLAHVTPALYQLCGTLSSSNILIFIQRPMFIRLQIEPNSFHEYDAAKARAENIDDVAGIIIMAPNNILQKLTAFNLGLN
jgi:hypothetical protein